jgi:hypothetical protein
MLGNGPWQVVVMHLVHFMKAPLRALEDDMAVLEDEARSFLASHDHNR